MQSLRDGVDLDRFWERVRTASERVLIMDYDGTLAPFQIKRDQAYLYPGVQDALNDILDKRHTRLVVVSGRALEDLKPLLKLNQPLELWGTHGWERQHPDGHTVLDDIGKQAGQGLAQAARWITESGWNNHCEYKPVSLALHWRGLPEYEITNMRMRTQEQWELIAEQNGLMVHQFDGGIELRVPGRDKGFAVKKVLSGLGAAAAIAYLGDDLTDEDAFQAIQGQGLSILVRPEYRKTAAELWIRPPRELLAFLQQWHEACIR